MIKNSALGLGQPVGADWRKSSHSGTSGTCVEVADLDDGHRAVRDSTNPTGPALTFTPTEWAVFTAGVCADEFG